MKLEQGTHLGPYEVVGPIGAGGMGEVWRARDTRLGRDVAIKILPAEFAVSAQLHARFEREAQAISQLEHPNICRLYDVGDAKDADGDGSSSQYLVMEYLEGESLADRLRKGPLPTGDVLRYGQQIASALDAAHRKGIVHRDLKPGNVMITRTGAKLLDFGLAKSESSLGSRGDDATQHKPLTQEGTVLGTYQYMAPEQLAGGETDNRSDIFALGVVLYEMLTGQRAFEGKTRTSLVSAIIGGEPRPLRELQPMTPPALEHVISKCLEKDPEHRWQSAHDLADELRWVSEAGSQAGVATMAGTRRKNRERLGWMMNAITALVAIAATAWFLDSRAPSRPLTESSIEIPLGFRTALFAGMAISPDATRLAVSLDDLRGSRTLWVRPMGEGAFVPLPGTNDAAYPFWSPDSKLIGFFANGRLMTIDPAGGAPQFVTAAPGARGGSWSRNGTILFAPALDGPLLKVDATGGEPTPVTRLRPGERAHRWPFFLPDGKHFLYVAMAAPGQGNGVFYASLEKPGEARLVVNAPSSVAVARGHLLYGRNGAVVAQKFEKNGSVSGVPIQIVQGVSNTERLYTLFSVAENGTIVAQRGPGLVASQLSWVERNGSGQTAITGRELLFSPRLSRDGKRMAVDRSNPANGQGDIWVYDLQRNVSSRLTFHVENESGPAWAPDDRHIYFHRGNQGESAIERVGAGGTGQVEILVSSAHEKRLTHVSHDGGIVLFDVIGTGTLSDIWVYEASSGEARPWLATPFAERGAELSPDGRWIAYQSDEAGRSEVYVRDFPDATRKWLISSGGGAMPSWRADGREMFYISSEGRMMAVGIRAGEELEAATPIELFDAGVRMHPVRQYDVTPDGSRFIVNRVDEAPVQPLTLITDWTSRLKE